MKGKYHFRVKSKKTVFEFEIRRNITVIQGDSATGKTTLLRMMYEYLRDNVIFIEENNNFVFTEDFAEFVKTSGNYFVIVNRSPLKMLPYSIHEIYEIVTEYSNSGYHFFKNVFCKCNVVSANGNSNIRKMLELFPIGVREVKVAH
jgi:predicted ABC-class ATPase